MKSVLMKDITKRFGHVMANDSAEFSAFSGEIHGLVGENAAGKSTLMKILAGMYRADHGEISIDGKQVTVSSPHVARQLGIAMVYQQFSLVDALTGLENVVLGSEQGGIFLRHLGDVEKSAQDLCRKFNFNLDLSSRVSAMTVGAKQQMEIVKALVRGAELLILDEPTSLLAPPEVAPLFDMMRTLRTEGTIVILISHKIEEVMDVADRMTVMRDGRVAASGLKRMFSRDSLAEQIVGARPEHKEGRARRRRLLRPKRPKLRVERLCLTRDGRDVLKNVSFSLQRGEILGVAGVVGNGQSELADVLGGFAAPTSGKIVIDGAVFARLSPAQARRAGVAHIPEDTRERALVPEMTVAENAFLGRCEAPGQFSRTVLKPKELKEKASLLIRQYDIRPPDPDAPIRTLSGGNQQKVVLARELSWVPSIVVAAYPTRGLDLRTRLLLHEQFLRLRRKGAAVLLISSDLEEVLELSDRVLVFYAGQTRGPFDLKELDQQRLGMLMTGAQGPVPS